MPLFQFNIIASGQLEKIGFGFQELFLLIFKLKISHQQNTHNAHISYSKYISF